MGSSTHFNEPIPLNRSRKCTVVSSFDSFAFPARFLSRLFRLKPLLKLYAECKISINTITVIKLCLNVNRAIYFLPC